MRFIGFALVFLACNPVWAICTTEMLIPLLRPKIQRILTRPPQISLPIERINKLQQVGNGSLLKEIEELQYAQFYRTGGKTLSANVIVGPSTTAEEFFGSIYSQLVQFPLEDELTWAVKRSLLENFHANIQVGQWELVVHLTPEVFPKGLRGDLGIIARFIDLQSESGRSFVLVFSALENSFTEYFESSTHFHWL
jgi:hypothetical protein